MVTESQDLVALYGQWWDLLVQPANARYAGQGDGNGNVCCCIKSGSLSTLGKSHSDFGEPNETQGQKPTENPQLLRFTGWK